jgi:cytochrome c-type biogenesis protein CcmH/NrfG
MERNESTAKPWSRTRVCGLAVICLLLIVSLTYLARASFQSNPVARQAGRPTVAHASDVKITMDQLKLEADKQAEPLLARLQKSPDDPFLPAEIGKIYFQMHQFRVAAKYYEDSVRLKPDAVVFVKLGGAHHFAGDEDRAIGAWNHALRLDPGNPDALFNIGLVELHARSNPKAAIAAWQKLLKMNPSHPKRAQVEKLLAQAEQQLETPIAGNE